MTGFQACTATFPTETGLTPSDALAYHLSSLWSYDGKTATALRELIEAPSKRPASPAQPAGENRPPFPIPQHAVRPPITSKRSSAKESFAS